MAIPDLDKLRAALPALSAEASERALEFEEARKLAPDFVAKLKHAGAYRILIPASAGGLGASLPEWFEILVKLAEADASTSWVVGHANICAAIIYAAADPQLRDELLADPDACAAWSSVPRIELVNEEADGIRISGSWSFVSGCTGATLGRRNGGAFSRPGRTAANGRGACADREGDDQGNLGHAWACRGTGSHDVCFNDVFVPVHQTFPWPAGRRDRTIRLRRCFPAAGLSPLARRPPISGLARRALDEARGSLRDKVDRYSGKTPITNPATQRILELAEGLWFACRAGMREALDGCLGDRLAWRAAVPGAESASQSCGGDCGSARCGHRTRSVRCGGHQRFSAGRRSSAPVTRCQLSDPSRLFKFGIL